MAEATREPSRLATVFGGSGFLGRYIVAALAREGWRVRVAVRRPDLAAFLHPIGGVGQVQAVQANLRFPASISAAIEGASMVVNATGLQAESGRQTFRAVHVEGAEALARAAAGAGVGVYIHISGIGADAGSASRYIASKGQGEEATLTAYPRANALIVEHVSALASAERWDVKELYAEAGRLDDVFRAITTPDAQRARERTGAAA